MKENSKIRSICVVRLSALGDVLMCVPALRRLQASFPNAKITWVISQPAYDLVSSIDGITFLVIDKPSSLGDYWRFYRRMRSQSFDILLAMQASFRANLLYPLIRAKRKIGYDSLRAKDGHFLVVKECITPGNDHTLEGFLKFATMAGSSCDGIRWDIPIAKEHRDFAASKLPINGPILLINPAASKKERSWPIERYLEAMRYAQHKWHCQLVLIGGPGEYDRFLADKLLANIEAVDLVGKTKPAQLLAIIAQADALLCPDTGPSHMAAAVNTPVLALHAVTSAQVSGPYPFRHLAVDYYPQAVHEVLQKTQESNVWGTHAHGKDTMKLVPVQAVLEKLDIIFSKRSLGVSA